MNTKLLNLFFISILIIVISCYASKMGLNNPLNASILGAEYSLDIQKGNKKYNGKYLTVVGEISQYSQNKFQENILILMDKDKKHGVKCTLIKSTKPLDRPFKLGQIIKVNGKCSGFDEFVLLTGCIILKE